MNDSTTSDAALRRTDHIAAIVRLAQAFHDAVRAYDDTVDDIAPVAKVMPLDAYPFKESLDEVAAQVQAWAESTADLVRVSASTECPECGAELEYDSDGGHWHHIDGTSCFLHPGRAH